MAASIETRPPDRTVPKAPVMFGRAPNSNGSIINMLPQSDVSVIQGTGPFRQNYAVGGGSRYCPNTVAFEENNRDGISFNLNYSNSLYEGSEFQLNALQILACIRC